MNKFFSRVRRMVARNNLLLLIAIMSALIGLLVPLIAFLFVELEYSKFTQVESFGLLGDWLGGSSSYFLAISGLILLILNYLIQRDQLNESRIELKNKRFEDSFFKFLNIRSQLIKNLKFKDNGNNYIGLEVLKRIAELLLENYKAPKNINNTWNENQDLSYARNFYSDDFLGSIKNFVTLIALSQYFKNTKEILKFIQSNKDISIEVKKGYVNIMMSTFSLHELIILFYMGVSKYGIAQGYKELFENLEIFKENYLSACLKEYHKKLYTHTANLKD